MEKIPLTFVALFLLRLWGFEGSSIRTDSSDSLFCCQEGEQGWDEYGAGTRLVGFVRIVGVIGCHTS